MTEYSERFVLAIDQGTTSTRCILFDRHGRLVVGRPARAPAALPAAGWVEHDAAEIWRNVTPDRPGRRCARPASAPDEVAALGITNQRETTVLWDRHTGVPVGSAIVWQDTRTAALSGAGSPARTPAGSQERCGLPLATYFSGAAAALAARPRRRAARTRGRARRACCSARWTAG